MYSDGRHLGPIPVNRPLIFSVYFNGENMKQREILRVIKRTSCFVSMFYLPFNECCHKYKN